MKAVRTKEGIDGLELTDTATKAVEVLRMLADDFSLMPPDFCATSAQLNGWAYTLDSAADKIAELLDALEVTSE